MTGGAILAVVIVAAAFAAMILSWRRRAAQRVSVPEPPADPGAVRATAAGTYLSTTAADSPLDRVVAGGLGFRAAATVSVTDSGVLLERRGSRPLFLDGDRLVGVGEATWTIDRAVERGGLTVLRWRLGDGADARLVESNLRLDPADRPALVAAVATLVPTPEVPDADH